MKVKGMDKKLFFAFFFFALFSLFIYSFSFLSSHQSFQLQAAKETSAFADGKEIREIRELVEEKERFHLLEGYGEKDVTFTSKEGQVYHISIDRLSVVDVFSYFAIPGLFMLLVSFLLFIVMISDFHTNNRAYLDQILTYLEELITGGFSEEGGEWNESFEELFTSEDHKREFLKALEQVKEHEDVRRKFSANVSHELKSPLTSINGYAEMIESGMVGKEDTRRFAAIIHREGVRLLNMINEVIQLSKFDTSYSDYDQRRYFDLVQTIDNEVESLELVALDHNVAMHFTHQEKVVKIFGNERLLTDVVRNLLSNAIKYSKQEGGEIVVNLSEQGDHIYFSVEDEGIGISTKDQARIFERFYVVDKARTRKENSGTGLGLSLVKHTVQSHGGRIELKSKIGVGSKFTVILPKKYEEEMAHEEVE